MFTTTHHCSIMWAKGIKSTLSHPTCLRYILILPSHLHLGLQNSLFPIGFPTKTLYLIILIIHDNTQIMKLLIMWFSVMVCYFLPHKWNILLSTLFLVPSVDVLLAMWDTSVTPVQNTKKYVFVCFDTFWAWREDSRLWTNDSQQSPPLIYRCMNFF